MGVFRQRRMSVALLLALTMALAVLTGPASGHGMEIDDEDGEPTLVNLSIHGPSFLISSLGLSFFQVLAILSSSCASPTPFLSANMLLGAVLSFLALLCTLLTDGFCSPKSVKAIPHILSFSVCCIFHVKRAADVALPKEDAATREFRAWCASAAIEIHPDLRLGVPTSRASRGVLAARRLTSGSTLLAVPLASMLTVEHAVIDGRYVSLWDALPDLPDADLLAAYVGSADVRNNSQHSGYLNYLPHEARDALHLGEEALELLRASPVSPRLQARVASMEKVRTLPLA